MGGCTSRPAKNAPPLGQAPASVAIPPEDAAERIRRLEEENCVLKAQLAVFNSQTTVFSSPSSPEALLLSPIPAKALPENNNINLLVPTFEKTNAFALSFVTPQKLTNDPPTPPLSNLPPPPDLSEFYENRVLPSPSSYFRSIAEKEHTLTHHPIFQFEPDALNESNLDTSINYDENNNNDSFNAISNIASPPALFTLHSLRSPSTAPFHATSQCSFSSPSATPTPFTLTKDTASPSTTTTTATTTTTTIPIPSTTTTTATTPFLTPRVSTSSPRASFSANYPNSPEARRRSLGFTSIPPCRRKSSASLSAGIAAAAAALSASQIYSPSSPPSFLHSLQTPPRRHSKMMLEAHHTTISTSIAVNNSNVANNSEDTIANETVEEEYIDTSPSSRKVLEPSIEEAFDTHDELYDCSEEDSDSPKSSEELPVPSRPLARALAVAREVRMKLLRKANAIEGLTRIKDAHFLNAKSKLVPSSHFNGKVLGLFLVGHQSLARCTEVIPDVVRWFQAATVSLGRPDFDVVLVWLSASILDPAGGGFGTSSQEYEQIRKLSPFYAAPFNSSVGVALYSMFCHKGTPSLVILDTDGAIINTNGLKSEGRRLRMSDELGPFPFRPDFDQQALELFNYLDSDQDGVLTRTELLAQSDNQESGEYVYEKLLLESEGGPITIKAWSGLLLTQLRASAGHQSDLEEIMDSFQDIFCFRPDSMSPAHR